MKTLDINKVVGRNLTIIPRGYYSTTVEHDSLILWQDTNRFSWFSKGIHGSPIDWLYLVEGLDKAEVEDLLEDDSLSKEFTFISDTEKEVIYPIGSKTYNPYIESRMISEDTAKIFQLETWDKYTIIPLYGYDGNRVGSMLRDQTTNVQWLKYRKIINGRMCNIWPYWLLEISHTAPVILYEGGWSCMRTFQVAKHNNISVIPLAALGTNMGKATVELLTGLDNVSVVLDNDKNKAGLSVKDRLESQKDFNTKWQFILPDKYPDEMSDNELLYLIRNII